MGRMSSYTVYVEVEREQEFNDFCKTLGEDIEISWNDWVEY